MHTADFYSVELCSFQVQRKETLQVIKIHVLKNLYTNTDDLLSHSATYWAPSMLEAIN